uniref:YadA C-terminal domain-containing protein n=1 Tax=Sneathia sanguinegens TaxID=40543 RepID=UPI0023FA0A91
LTGITSITSGDNKAKITLNDDNITVNKKITGLTAGTAETDAINKKQFDEELGKKLDKTTYNEEKKNFATKTEITNKLDNVTLNSSDSSVTIEDKTASNSKNKTYDLKVNANGTISATDEKAVSGKTVHTYVEGIKNNFTTSLGDYAKKDLDNITTKGKEEIKKLVNVSKADGNDNILEITGGTETNGQAKDYKLSVKKSTIEGIAKAEAKKFVSDSVKVSSTDGAITVDTDKTTDANVINYKLTLNETKIKSLAGTANLATEYAKVDGTNLTNLDDTKKKAWATGIGTSSIDATTKDELVTDTAVKEYVDGKVKNISNVSGTGKDGRDGNNGTNGAGSKGLTGKDGLNGKDLTTKVNALRNGEAGTVVYTDKDGNRLVKANDGKYYDAKYVDDNGALKVGHSSADEVKDISATLVNPDGSTTTPTTKLRVADGSIAKDSKDAINGGQLKTLGYMLGLEVNEKNTGFKAPKITDLKGTNTTPANILDGLNQTREQMNKGLIFEANYNADPYGTSNINKMLGGTLSITASGAENGKYAGTNNSNYTGTNLATYVKTDNGKKKIFIGMKETPTFKSINIGSSSFGNNQKDLGPANISADDNGLTLTHDGASVTITKDGDKVKLSGLKDFDVNSSDYGKENSGIAATQKEVKDVLNKINANGTEQDKLKNGTLGTLVYTDKDGNKLMKDTDGKFYKTKENGQKEDNAQEITKENIILSTVNSDGKTIEPITLGNVASALGLSKDKKENKEVIKKLINKEAKKDLEYTEAELNKVVTLRDLQFLASKGITFAGSTGTATKFLGDTITINESNSTGLTKENFATKYETKNIAVKVDNNTGNIEVGLAKELKKINSIESDGTDEAKKTKVTLTEKGTEFKTGTDGVTTKIVKDGIEITKKDATKPSISIKESSINFETKEEGQDNNKKTVGTGSITGLKDLDDNSDGHMAANKNYVDKKFDDVANKVVNINKQVNQNINGIKQNSKDIKSLGEKIKTVEKLSKSPIKFGTNSGYVDKKLGDAIKIKGTGTVTKKYDEEYNSNNIATKTDEKGNIVIGISKELKDMKSFETEQDKTTGNSSKLDQNGLTITDKNGTKENPRHTVEITKDKIVFKKEYKDGNKDNVENGIVIDNKSNTITGIKTKDTDKGDTVVSKQYVDDKLSQKPFEYFIKNTVLGSDGKEYSKDTVEVDGKRFEGTDKVIKGEDNNYYKEKDIKGRKYDSKTHLWSGADIQPTPVDEAKPLNSTNLVRGKDGKFYNPIDLEDAIYDKDSNKYKKNGADVTGGKEANDVVIKALPNIKPMALSNIGDGRMIANSTDAVNGGQVFEALKGKLDKDGSNIEQKSFATNASKGADLSKPEDILVTDKQVSEHLKNNYYNKTQVNNMISTIDNKSTVALEKSELALGGVANAVAMANLVQVNSYSRHRHNLSAAYGYYGGSHALAVGFSGTNEERNFVYKLSGSVNNKGNLALGVGAGVMLGDVDEHNINKLNVKKVTKKLEFANEKIEKYEKRQQETDKKIKELSEYKEKSEKRIQELEKKLERLIKNK